ncbi:hypothetical protein ACFE04_008707 [Oxalis oulophora]
MATRNSLIMFALFIITILSSINVGLSARHLLQFPTIPNFHMPNLPPLPSSIPKLPNFPTTLPPMPSIPSLTPKVTMPPMPSFPIPKVAWPPMPATFSNVIPKIPFLFPSPIATNLAPN